MELPAYDFQVAFLTISPKTSNVESMHSTYLEVPELQKDNTFKI